MTRIKRGVTASKRRKKVTKMAKGFRWRRKSTFRAAKEALLKAGKYAHRDRRAKKRTMRGIFIVRLNNALRANGIAYSKFVKLAKEKQIALDRKILSQLANSNPQIFAQVVEKVK